MEQMEDYVWCDCHGCIHEKSTNPYDGPPYEVVDGRPVWYSHRDEDGNLVEAEPECGPEEWRVLWAGRRIA